MKDLTVLEASVDEKNVGRCIRFTSTAAGKKKKVELIAHRLPSHARFLWPEVTNQAPGPG